MPIITCSDCNEQKDHYSMGRCHICYNRHYFKIHPEQYEKIRKRQNKKYHTDLNYRKRLLEWHREYYITHKDKLLEYARNYNKEHPRRGKLQRWKVGLLCPCGGIDKGIICGKPNNNHHSTGNKCPHCGQYTIKKKVIFDRYTMKVLRTVNS